MRKIGYRLHKGTETLVRDRERFDIEGVRDRESQLYSQKGLSIASHQIIPWGTLPDTGHLYVWNANIMKIVDVTTKVEQGKYTIDPK